MENPFEAVNPEMYDLPRTDKMVAVMIKCYLACLPKEKAAKILSHIVKVGVRNLPAPTQKGHISVQTFRIPKKYWTTIDGFYLAKLIDAAKAAVSYFIKIWNAEGDELLLRQSLYYLREGLLPSLSGETYVTSMPVGMAEFLTDLYLACKGC